MKACTRCGETKELNEFHIHPNGKFGRTNHCKACKSEYARQRYERDREGRLDQMRVWREANPEKVVENRRRYAESQGRTYAPKVRRSAEERAAAKRAYTEQYRAANPEVVKERITRWKRANSDKLRDYSLRRRARLAGAQGDHTHEDWLRILRVWGFACAYCGNSNSLTKEHVVPISRGGSNFIGNIIPACLSCNSSKCDKLLIEWAGRRGIH